MQSKLVSLLFFLSVLCLPAGLPADEKIEPPLNTPPRDLTDKSLITTRYRQRREHALVKVKRKGTGKGARITYALLYSDTSRRHEFESFEALTDAVEKSASRYVFLYLDDRAVNHPLSAQQIARLRTLCPFGVLLKSGAKTSGETKKAEPAGEKY